MREFYCKVNETPISGLRPIGSEFDIVYPPDITSSDNRPKRIRYRIVGYKEYIDEYHKPTTAENLLCIRIEYLTPVTYFKV